jgi:uncharacterized protein YkwD
MIIRSISVATVMSLVIGCGQFCEKCEKDEPEITKPEPAKPTPQPTPQPQPQPDKPGNPFPFPLPFPIPPGLPIPDLPIPGGGDTTQPAPTPPSEDTIQQLADEINAARKSRGLGEVTVELALNCAAKRHADDIGIKRVCGHTGSDGSSPWDRAQSCGTSADGEIVACGQGSPKAAVDAWTLSPGHAAIMYAPNQSVVGVAMLNNYWVAIFR